MRKGLILGVALTVMAALALAAGDGYSKWPNLKIGGGYGGAVPGDTEGLTVEGNGDVSTNGDLTVDGELVAGTFSPETIEYNVEAMGTAGAVGTAPVSDGDTTLTMTDIATQTELSAKADTGHAHTGSTLSGIDTSDDTDLSAGSGIVLTDDALSHSTANGYVHIPATGAANQFLQYSSAGTAAWATLGGDVSLSGGTATIAADSVALITDTAGDYVASLASGLGLTGGAAGTEGATLTLALDESAALSGTHTLTANQWIPALSGIIFEGPTADAYEGFIHFPDIASVSKHYWFPDEGGNIAIMNSYGTAGQSMLSDADGTVSWGTPAVAADSVALTTSTTGNYVASTSNGLGITGSAAAGEGATPTFALDESAALTGDHTLSANTEKFGVNGIVFEGATADTIEGYLTLADPATTDKTWTWPNRSGYVMLSGDTVSGDVTGTLENDGDTVLAVANDSHAHTTTTISGIDTSDDTDLSAGSGIVLTDDALSHSTANGYVHIPANGAANQFLQYSSAGTAAWATLGGDVSLSGGTSTIAANSVALTTDTTGNYVASVATSGALSGGAAGSEGAALTITHSTANGYVHIPSDGAANQFLQYSSAGTAAWTTPTRFIQINAGVAPAASGGCDAGAADANGNVGAVFALNEIGYFTFFLPADFDGSIDSFTVNYTGTTTATVWTIDVRVVADAGDEAAAFGSDFTSASGTPANAAYRKESAVGTPSAIFGTSANAGKQATMRVVLTSGAATGTIWLGGVMSY